MEPVARRNCDRTAVYHPQAGIRAGAAGALAQHNSRRRSMRARQFGALVLVVLCFCGCGYNNLQRQDENVKAAWAQVVNEYQRRADLVPNLVNTVKGFAAQEQQVLIGVTEARAKVGSIQVSPETLNNPDAFAKYQAAQNQLT